MSSPSPCWTSICSKWGGHISCTRSAAQTYQYLLFSYGWSSTVILCSSGLLGKCPDLQIILSGNYHHCVTWSAPSTLNITAVEPDISSYTVCNNISTECITINVTEAGSDSSDLRKHVFPNLRAYINFTVTAVNIVGDSESTSKLYEPCEHTEGGKCI